MDKKTQKKKTGGLGRGLNALFDNESSESPFSSSFTDNVKIEENNDKKVVILKHRDIEPNPSQPRKTFDREKLEALSDSIKAHGIVQPILVKKASGGMYTIIAGERRWRAAKLAGLKEIPCIIKDYDEKELMEIALVENLQREDLNPIEEAEGYKRLMDAFSLNQEEVAERVGKSRSAIANSLRLNNLSSEVKKLVTDGKLSQGHARTLLSVDDKKLQLELAEKIIEEGLSVRQTEKLVSQNTKLTKEKVVPPQTSDIIKRYFSDIETNLSQKLGTKVKILSGKKKGKIEIEYYSKEDLERLLKNLNNI